MFGGDPLVESAVEHRDVVVAEDAEHPPHARRRRTAEEPVVDDHAIAVSDAEQSDFFGEVRCIRQHVRQIGIRIGDVIDVEMDGARQMPAAILIAAVEIGARMMPGAVENANVAVAQMLG